MSQTSGSLQSLLTDSAMQKQSQAYTLSFTIENALRVSVHNVMVKRKGVKYFNETVFPPFILDKYSKEEINAVKRAIDTKNKEQQVGFKKGYERHHLWYLDFAVLVALINQYWENYFCLVFESPGKVKSRLLDLLDRVIPIRNSIAHHRYVSDSDLLELGALSKLLQSSIKKEYINNFSELVLNPVEYVIEDTMNLIKQIEKQIDSCLCINPGIVLRFRSAISACEPVLKDINGCEGIDKLIMDMWEYNKLPRKPGSSEVISDFITRSGILLRLSELLQSLELSK